MASLNPAGAEKQPGFAKIFFYLEQELLKPRFEIHSLSPGEIVAQPAGRPIEDEPIAQDQAARVLFSAAESLNPPATATLHNNLDKQANMVLVDLGIPPGFELQTEDLQTMVENTAHARTGRLEKFNLTATQAILYFNGIGVGQTIKVHFRLRAKYPIRAKTFTSRVYEYYDPAVSATARPTTFQVVAR